MTTPDCQSCGLCCVCPNEDQGAWADVDEADCERLGVKWVKRNVDLPELFNQVAFGHTPAIKTKWLKQRSGPMKGTSVCVCVALRGTLLKKVRCSVYDQRPRVCREAVLPGDPMCLSLQREHSV